MVFGIKKLLEVSGYIISDMQIASEKMGLIVHCVVN